VTRNATVRLFVAIDPPAEVSDELAAWAKVAVKGMGARGGGSPVRLLHPELLHLTLCFLGSRPVGEVAAIEDALATCAEPVGELEIGAPVWLPPRRPRALAVEVRDDAEGSLATLHGGLLDTLAQACGFAEERQRRLLAHITVARMRDSHNAGRRAAGEPLLPPTPQLSFVPTSIVLYRSWLSPAGAVYEALASRTLAPL
jgi:2'-5' RNA ligase